MTIKVTYDGKTLQDADETKLRKRTIIDEDDNEHTVATEYRDYGSDQIIHRSVAITLKKMPAAMQALAGKFE